MPYYQSHLFLCTYLREAGKRCCGTNEATEAGTYIKERLKSLNLHGSGQHRVSLSACLGRCKLGPVLVIYPEAVWYTYNSQEDLDEIIDLHLLQGKRVDRLLLPTNDNN